MRYIESKANPIIKKANATILGKTPLAMIEGKKLLKEAIRSNANIDFILTSEKESKDLDGLYDKVYQVPQKILNSLSSLQTPPTTISFILFPKVKKLEDTLSQNGLHIVLDRLQDPGNAGTIIRTAEAMGATSIILLKGSCAKNNYKLIRAAMGSAFRLPIYDEISPEELFNLCIKNKIQTVCADMKGEKIKSFKFLEKCVIFFGQEGKGISNYIFENCNSRISIPMPGPVESLNVAISAAICLYEWSSRQPII